MSAFDPLIQSKIDVIDAIEQGAAAVDAFHAPEVGPTDYDALDFPYIQVLPENTTDQGGNEFQHQVRLNCYFERDRGDAYTDYLRAVGDATTNALAALSDEPSVVSFRPTTIEDYAGELNGTLILLVSVQVSVGTLVDLGA